MRYVLHSLAAGVLILGVALATLLPDGALAFCFDWRIASCAGADPLVVRAVIAAVAAVTALVVWMVGSTTTE